MISSSVSRSTAPGEDVTGEQQDGQTVYGCSGCSRHHIGRAWPDRTRTCESAQPMIRACEGRRSVNHRLFVSAQIVPPTCVLLKRLPYAGEISVTEDPKAAGEEWLLASVASYMLLDQKLDDGLSHGESSRSQVLSPSSHPYASRDWNNSSASHSVGMKFAHPCRVTTIAPVALPMLAARSQSQPLRCP